MVTERKIEELDNLPSRERVRIINSDRYRWRKGDSYHKVGDYYPYKIIDRILNHNIGKSFDNTFSYYCKNNPKYQQHIFLSEFFNNYRYYYSWRNDFYIDNNNLIQTHKEPKKSKPIVFYSDDYKIEYYNTLTGFAIKEYNCINYKTKLCKVYGYTKKSAYFRNWYELNNSFINTRIVDGKEFKFESKKDPRYQRFIQEKLQQDKKKNKIPKKVLTDQEFRNLLKQRDLKEREENLIKIISHGFDPLTSFRKRKKNDMSTGSLEE